MWRKDSFMNAPQNLLLSWIKFALFELISLMICFVVTSSAWKLGVFNEDFIRSSGLWKATFVLFGLWFVLSSMALIHYRWRMDVGVFIFSTAVIASPLSAFAFCMGYGKEEGFAFLAFLTIVSTMIGLAAAMSIIKISELLEDKIYPLFRYLGF